MPTLIVIRHAKAVDRLEAEDDFERGLTERGRADASRAADAISAAGFTATHALVSPSRRTRETWKVIAERLGNPPVTDPMALYHASTEMLERAVLEQLAKGAQSIAVVGHNPGIGGFIHALATHARTKTDMPLGWPTSGAAVFELAPDTNRVTARDLLLLFDPKA
jgi:phosphohistidine phosphatase